MKEVNVLAIKIVLLILFAISTVFVGWYSRKHATNVNDFVLGGRSVGSWLTAFAYGTSYFSAVVFIGYAGQFGWKYGISTTWIGLGNALLGSFFAWLVLAKRTRSMSQHLKTATMPDFFGKRYGSQAIKIMASIIVFVFLIPYTSSVYTGLSRLFEVAFDVPYTTCVVCMAVITAVYVILGGYMATAINDFIQGLIMIVGIILVIMSVLNGHGGFMESLVKLSKETDASMATEQVGVFTSFFGPDPLNLLGVIILTSLGTWGLPQMIHKFYAIKNEKSIKTGTIVSTVFAVIVAGGSYFLGGFSRLFSDNPNIYNADGGVIYDAIIPQMLTTLPDILIGIVIVLVLSASMSTLSSLVLTSSSTVTLDMIKGHIVKGMSEKKQLLFMRVLILFFIALSVIIALNPPTFIAQLMGVSWGALAGAFLAPFLYGLYWKGVTKASVWISFIFGVGFIVLNMYVKFIESPINAGAITMIIGLIIVPLVSFITPKMEKKLVDDIFDCYKK